MADLVGLLLPLCIVLAVGAVAWLAVPREDLFTRPRRWDRR